MKDATLRDEVTGKIHDLAGLVMNHGNELTIGRNNDRVIVIKDSKGVSYVSKIHATIFYDKINDVYLIRDDESTNGTRVNGDLLESQRQLKRLDDGDQLSFGIYGPLVYEEPKATSVQPSN